MSNQLQISGEITKILDVVSGVSKAGKEWNKQDFVLKTDDQYPKQVCFTLFGQNIEFLTGISEGTTVNVLFNIDSREFNGKWYHNINALNVSKMEVKPIETAIVYPLNNEPVNDDPQTDLPF